MIGSGKVGWTLVAVILVSFCVQWISCRAVFVRQENRGEDNQIGISKNGNSQNAIIDGRHKHLRFLKTPNPTAVEKVKKRLKARLKGRKPDQSNERNLWIAHPKNENWSGPDTEEVYEVFTSLGV